MSFWSAGLADLFDVRVDGLVAKERGLRGKPAPDTFLAMQCRDCTVVYLDPRPAPGAMGRIYPDDYHAFDFTEADFGIIHKVRSKLEARRLVRMIGDVPSDAKIKNTSSLSTSLRACSTVFGGE